MCPISMTYASVPALRHQSDVAAQWVPKIVGGRYDAPLKPSPRSAASPSAWAMTEKQAAATCAPTRRAPSGMARPGASSATNGSARRPMCDAFLTLAQTEAGLSCFLVPRIRPDGERNSLHVMRLKDKARQQVQRLRRSSITTPMRCCSGRRAGLSTIIEMVHHTRLDTIAGTIGIMRMALAQAHHHVANRRAFQKTLIDQPPCGRSSPTSRLEYEAAVALTLRVARAFSGTSDHERAFARLAVAVAKYWLTKRNPNFVYECMECHGGAGYVRKARCRGCSARARSTPSGRARQCHRAGHPAHASARAGGARGLRRR